MILKIENGQIKNIKISFSSKSLKDGEVFVPEDWGTDEIRNIFFSDIYEPSTFCIKENPDKMFELFDVSGKYNKKEINKNISNFSIQENPDNPFFLFKIESNKDISNKDMSSYYIEDDPDLPFVLFNVLTNSLS